MTIKHLSCIGGLNFPITKADAVKINPLVLAFVGDSVQMLFIRTKLALSHDFKSGKLHLLAADVVNATAQARTYDSIKENLSEEELDVYKRARNSKTLSSAKNAKITDYRKATGLEAVIGYLYLIGETGRLNALLNSCLPPVE